MAKSDEAFRALIARLMLHYRDHLFDPHWGESIRLSSDNMLHISMVVQGLDQAGAEAAWAPFVEWVKSAPDDYSIESPIGVLVIPAQRIWDVDFLNAQVPGVFGRDDRPGAPSANAFWAGDQEQAGQFLHGYRSAWLPASLLGADQLDRLADALFACSRKWGFALHFNKGLAGAPAAEIAAARDTATNPDVLDAFALAIIASEGPPAFRAIAGHEPDLAMARDERRRIDLAMAELLAVAPGRGSYLSESDYFEPDWQRSFWGPNYPRLAAVKRRYDPQGLFFVHHGVGSEGWSADGFTKLT
jgi:FAD/FMN-containing dehydrogenase